MTSGDLAPLIATGGDQTLKVTVDVKAVERVISLSPKIAHFWLQGFLHRARSSDAAARTAAARRSASTR